MKKLIVLFLFLQLSLFNYGEEKSFLLEEVVNPSTISVYKDKILIVEDHTIFVYNKDNMKQIAKFGRKGEGPGEFKMPPNVTPLEKNIFVSNPGRVYWFSYDGKLQKETRANQNWWYLDCIGKNFIRNNISPDFKNRVANLEIILLDSKMKPIKTLYKGSDEAISFNLSQDTGKEIKRMTPHCIIGKSDGRLLYIADSKKGCYFEIYNDKGDLVQKINPKIKPSIVSEEFKKNAMQKLKESKDWQRIKKNDFVFYETFPAIKNFSISPKNLYVQTYITKENKRKFIIINKKSNKIIKKDLPKSNIYAFDDEFYYYLETTNDDEDWVLKKIAMSIKHK